MARRKSFVEAQEEFQSKFPDKTLLTFDGTVRPCTIKCPIHGEVEWSAYRSAMKSPQGCPACGDAAHKNAASEFLKTRNAAARLALQDPAIVSNLKTNTASLKPWSNPEDLSKADFVFVPYLKDIGLAAGCGHVNGDSSSFQLPFGRATLRRKGIDPEKVVCCTVDGDSMEPMLMDGSTVGINTADRDIKDGKVYAIVQDGLSRIKVLSREPGESLRIRSLNPAYPDEVVPVQEVEVVGKMFWCSTLF